MSDKASLSDILTHDKRGGFFAVTVDKAPRPISPYTGDSRRPPPDLGAYRRPRRGRWRAASEAHESEADTANALAGKRFRHRRRSRRGRGRAAGRGRAIRCSSPARASLCLTHFCAASRPRPGPCAPAWRFRAPQAPPRSCGSTPMRRPCATCASPSATTPVPQPNCSAMRDLAARPPSLDAAGSPRRQGSSTWPWTRTASHPA